VTLDDLGGPRRDRKPRSWWALGLAVAVLITVGSLTVALILGTIGFETRRIAMHQARLRKLATAGEPIERVTQGLQAEGARIVADAEGAGAIREVARTWMPPLEAAAAEKAGRWQRARVVDTGDMVYLLLFDEGRALRDFIVWPKSQGKSPPGERP
jgi:hypothetical protein